MKDYLRTVWYYLVMYDDDGLDEKTGWQMLKVYPGPINTMWGWSLKLRYNWFTTGMHCWRKGHSWRRETIAIASAWDWQKDAPGMTRVKHTVTVCAVCGNYRGRSTEPL